MRRDTALMCAVVATAAATATHAPVWQPSPLPGTHAHHEVPVWQPDLPSAAPTDPRTASRRGSPRGAPPRVHVAVTDVFLASAWSHQDAVDTCEQNAHATSQGVTWTTNDGRALELCIKRTRVDVLREQAASSTSTAATVVQRIAVYAWPDATPQCHATEDELVRVDDDSVVVCIRRIVASPHVLASGNFLSDLWVSSNRNYNSDVPGWTRMATNVHAPLDSFCTRMWRWLWAPWWYTGAFLSFQRPLLPIRDIVVVTTSGVTGSAADVCIDQLGGEWESVGSAMLESDGADDSTRRKTVLCMRRAGTSDTIEGALVADVQVVTSDRTCGGDATRLELPSQRQALCVTYASDRDDSVVFLADLRLEATAHAHDLGHYDQVSDHNLNENGDQPVFLYAQSAWKPIELVPEKADEDGLSHKPPLTARAIGKDRLEFKILQLADLHYSGDATTACHNVPVGMNPSACSEAVMTAFVNELLDLEQPDLVVFSGDNVQVYDHALRQRAIDVVTSGVEARGIPYAVIFGNHDDQNGFTRAEQMRRFVAKPHAYVRRGPVNIAGVGNYEISIRAPIDDSWGQNGSDVFRLYFLDSHAYIDKRVTPEVETKYDWIQPNQIGFYRQLAQGHAGAGDDVPAIMFFHIPLPEYTAESKHVRSVGSRVETSCASEINSNLFASLVELGEVKAAFCGHDHVNDFCFKRDGVQLCYGGGIGFGIAYGNSVVPRRARVIEWSVDDTNKRTIRSWRRLFGEIQSKALEEVLYEEEGSK